MGEEMNKHKTGLVIGRFQPFHLGHKYLIEKALEDCEKIIIGIGSSNVTDDANPYSYRKRKKFLEEFIKQEEIEERVAKIISIKDVPDDDKWLTMLLRKTGKIDVSIGDNEWVNGIFEKAEISVKKIGFYNREELEGTKIRELIRDKKKWEKRVPECLVPLIDASE